jgi:hypothetical protein
MTLSNLSIYVVFVDSHQGINDVMPFSTTTKAYVELHRSGENINKTYLQFIYCKVKR